MILKYPDPILTTKCEPIDFSTDPINTFFFKMIFELGHELGLGLAAPQIGISKRMFIIDKGQLDRVQHHDYLVFINPEITSLSKNTIEMDEGCLSFPGVYYPITRPTRVEIRAKNLKGEGFGMECGGLMARCIQHEYDHLDGKLFASRVDWGGRVDWNDG